MLLSAAYSFHWPIESLTHLSRISLKDLSSINSIGQRNRLQKHWKNVIVNFVKLRCGIEVQHTVITWSNEKWKIWLSQRTLQSISRPQRERRKSHPERLHSSISWKVWEFYNYLEMTFWKLKENIRFFLLEPVIK